MYAVLLLQFSCGHDALPGGRELDQDTLLVDAFLLVQTNDLQGSLHLSILIEAQPSVDLSGDCGKRARLVIRFGYSVCLFGLLNRFSHKTSVIFSLSSLVILRLSSLAVPQLCLQIALSMNYFKNDRLEGT